MSAESWEKEFYPVPAYKVGKEKAIKHSLVKWYGLRKENLEKHGLTEPTIFIDDESCALCVNYFVDVGEYCQICPLAEFLGDRCDAGSGSVYKKYKRNKDPEPMIAALEAISFVEDVCK